MNLKRGICIIMNNGTKIKISTFKITYFYNNEELEVVMHAVTICSVKFISLPLN